MTESPVATSPARTASWLVLAACAGASTMVVELAAVRLLGPWFGTSQVVWTNVIGVVLLALSAGYLLGGRLSTRSNPERSLGIVLLLASAWSAALPAAAPHVARAMLPEGLTLEAAAALLGWGSLAASAVLFLPPALFLGCVSPLCTEILDRARGSGAGLSGGRVLCASTLGSLCGTFATTFVLLPSFGLRATFALAAAVLALLAALALWLSRARRLTASAPAMLLPLLAPAALHPPVRAGGELLAERETPYQSARVVAYARGTPSERRELQVNEAFDSFQSLWIPRTGAIGDGSYYDLFALPAWWAGASGTWRVGVLGLCAGTTWRVLDGTLPKDVELDTWGVEIDARVVDLAREHMGLVDGPRRRILAGWDARAFLAQAEIELDQIVLDAYANQMEIPAHLCTREFFALARARLAPGGIVCANVGAFGLDDPVLEALAGSLAAGMEEPVLAVEVPFSRNVVVFARRGAPLPEPGAAAWSNVPAPLDALARRLELPGVSRVFRAGEGVVLVDDLCDIERRQARSIARAGARARELDG